MNNKSAGGVTVIVRKMWTPLLKFKSGMRLFAFHIILISLRQVWIQLLSLQLWVNSRAGWALKPWHTIHPTSHNMEVGWEVTHESRLMCDRRKNVWSSQYFLLEAPQTPSNHLSPALQVVPVRKPPPRNQGIDSNKRKCQLPRKSGRPACVINALVCQLV